MINHPVALGLIKICRSIWPVILYIIIGLALYWRWEKNEKKRLEEVIKRKELKRKYNQKYVCRD